MTEPDIVRVIDDLKHCDGRHRNIGVYTFDNAIEAIEQLRKERDQSIRERDEARRRYQIVLDFSHHLLTERAAARQCAKKETDNA